VTFFADFQKVAANLRVCRDTGRHHQLATAMATNNRAMTVAAAARSTAAGNRCTGILGVLATLLPLALAACGIVNEQTASMALVSPGKFKIYTCDDIATRMKAVRSRELELEQLMARSAHGAGGQFVNAIAYQSDYLQAKGELKALADAAAEKNCTSQSQWSSGRSIF
jgi:hypothetical protein